MVEIASPEVCGWPVTPEMGGPPNGDLGPEDNCMSLIFVETDGTVRKVSPREATLGTVPRDELVALQAAIESTDFEAIRREPWENMCLDGVPTWDSFRYDFLSGAGLQRVETCGTELDRAHPLFVALADALEAVGQPLPAI